MSDLVFKKIAVENWLVPDPVSTLFWAISTDDQPHVMSGEDWLQLILRPQLIDYVPSEINRLYEVARGAMVYGFFFYPLYTLAGEQLFRVAEAAVTLKCELLDAPSKAGDFYKRLKWLAEQNIISSKQEHQWHKIRLSRNFASHPQNQNIMPPGFYIDFLSYITEEINKLFEPGNESDGAT